MQIGRKNARMMGPRLEQAISSLITRARLYEKIAHDPGPWLAVLHDTAALRIPLERYVRPDRVVLIGYLREPGACVRAAEIWCGDDMMASWPVDPPAESPVRVSIILRIEDAEMAA